MTPDSMVARPVDPLRAYLAGKGIDLETAEHFGVRFERGDGDMRGRIVVPVHNREAELIACAGRALNGAGPAWKFSAGFEPSADLFNHFRALSFWHARYTTPRVVLVEDPFDCMKVHQAGFESVIALMGDTLSLVQEKAIARDFGLVAVMLPNPEAVCDVVCRLARRVHVRIVEIPHRKSVSSLALSEIRDLLIAVH